MKNPLILALNYQRRHYLSFYLIFFSIYFATAFASALLLNIFSNGQGNMPLLGLFFGGIIASFIAAIICFQEDFPFMLLNGLDRKTVTLSFLIDGFFFTLIYTVCFFLIDAIFHLLPLPLPFGLEVNMFFGQFQAIPSASHFLWAFLALATSYYAGLLIAAIFYALSNVWRSVLVFFGFFTASFFFGAGPLLLLFNIASPQELSPLFLGLNSTFLLYILCFLAVFVYVLLFSLLVRHLNVRYQQ